MKNLAKNTASNTVKELSHEIVLRPLFEFQPTIRNLKSAPVPPPRFINIGLAPTSADPSDDVTDFVSKTAALKIHRTANYLVAAASPDSEETQPIVAYITALLGQKTIYLQSTLQVSTTLETVTKPWIFILKKEFGSLKNRNAVGDEWVSWN